MTDVDAHLSEFFQLASDAARRDEDLDEPTEPAFEAVLTHVLAHPEFRPAFGTAFLSLVLDPSKGPPELIEYCMHVLRWAEVKDALVRWLATEQSERVRHILKKLIMSFEDDWHHAGLYNRFATDRA